MLVEGRYIGDINEGVERRGRERGRPKMQVLKNLFPEFLKMIHSTAPPCQAREFLVLISPYSLILKTYKLEA